MNSYEVNVSIIVPVYNTEIYLKRCIESLINQTFKNIEIIAINDGSTDKSLSILEKYKQKDCRIKVINNENLGVSNSRNKGISESCGKFIMFVDSDDWLDLDAVNIMYNKAINNNSDIVMCSYIREFENRSKAKVFDLDKEVVYEKESINLLNRQLIGPIDEELKSGENLDSLGSVWAKLYKSDVIKDNNIEFVNLQEIGTAEDSLFNIFLFKYINKVTFINNPLYHYWKDNLKSITSKYNPYLINQWHNLFAYMNSYIIENKLDESFSHALRNRICLSVLGLGLNECNKSNKSTIRKKINNIKKILEDDLIMKSYESFDISRFPIHWRIFYFLNKNRIAYLSFFMLSTIEFVRTKL